ncbi:DUF6880 family protein [Burkholderia sp. Ac-20365]|uniref:SWIM zinc finger family protein n=1 Tax=Burkholderia sp. Ac-20365 TaxID=2703897 RepID=UPI00197BAB66|nr:DUF6880 family protein [Burkholderia sp. Ac-20365]MBN3767470.1 hypothetical protein [Burkholderia sp. Ac-20365]
MSQSAYLAEFLTLAEVLSLTDAKTFARGKVYFHDGMVSRLDEEDDTVRANVRGTQPYQVKLSARHGELSFYCDCPVGQSAVFCKHAVAVALSWLENSGAEVFQPDETEPKKPRKKRKTYAEQVQEYVASLGADALRSWLMEAVERDVALRDKLLLAARAASSNDLPGMRIAVRQTARVKRVIHDWREAAEYADGLMSLCDVLRERLNGSHAADVVELAELALAEAESGLERIDDSSGDVMPAIQELAAVHLEACERTRPEPEELARRLFRFLLESPWGTFNGAFPRYAEALGGTGQHVYRELCNDAWNRLPPPQAGKRADYTSDVQYSKLRRAMTALAEFDGDVDALIRIESKDLSNPHQFLKVAALCEEHGRLDEGLAWAEKGIEASGKTVHSDLLTFCVDGYVSRREFDKADEYAWRRFMSYPGAATFKVLMTAAKATGSYDRTRERALDHMWAMVGEEEAGGKTRDPWAATTRTELVELYLDARDNEAAWHAFTGGPIAAQICQPMAAVRGRTHPRDALVVYQRLLPGTVERGTSAAQYKDAFEIVKAIGKLWARLGEHAQFEAELNAIRQTYRAKRKFIALLDTLK